MSQSYSSQLHSTTTRKKSGQLSASSGQSNQFSELEKSGSDAASRVDMEDRPPRPPMTEDLPPCPPPMTEDRPPCPPPVMEDRPPRPPMMEDRPPRPPMTEDRPPCLPPLMERSTIPNKSLRTTVSQTPIKECPSCPIPVPRMTQSHSITRISTKRFEVSSVSSSCEWYLLTSSILSLVPKTNCSAGILYLYLQDQTYQIPPQQGVYQTPPQQGVYQIPLQQGLALYQTPPQKGVYQTPPQQGPALYQTPPKKGVYQTTPQQGPALYQTPPQQGIYQTPRQALLHSIATFDKEVLNPWPEYAKSADFPPTHHVLTSGVVPPRDLQRRSPTIVGGAKGKYDGRAESERDSWNPPLHLTPSR